MMRIMEKHSKLELLLVRHLLIYLNGLILCSPTAPTTAFKKGANLNDPMQMYLSHIATIPVNLAGLPALSLPCGLMTGRLPIGLQLTGSWFDELSLLQSVSV